MLSLASSSVACSLTIPPGNIERFSILVRSNISDTSASGLVRRSSNPRLGGKPSNCSKEGLATSASTSITVLLRSAAILMAMFTAVKLLPSLGKALPIMTRFPFAIGAAPFPMAFWISGRLSTRYSSANWDRGASGVINRFAAITFRSRVTRLDRTSPLTVLR